MTDLAGLASPNDDGTGRLPWSQYAERLQDEFHALLDDSVDERRMQRFLERHPPLVPGAFPEFAGHGAFLDAMVAQPPLQGLGKRIPDFMWIARHSGAVIPVLIEIESPSKKWIAGTDPPRASAELTQALAQLREWREWMSRPTNQQTFLDTYRIPEEWRARRLEPIYMLIYGRADENREVIGKLRTDDRDHLLAYDHLEPRPNQDDYITVRNDGAGGYTALHMPACARLSPTYDDWWRMIAGRRDMVHRNDWISDDGQAYLLDRIDDWDRWADRYRDEYARRFGRRPRPMGS